jgi:Flp pilus assembly secretin CpaC
MRSAVPLTVKISYENSFYWLVMMLRKPIVSTTASARIRWEGALSFLIHPAGLETPIFPTFENHCRGNRTILSPNNFNWFGFVVLVVLFFGFCAQSVRAEELAITCGSTSRIEVPEGVRSVSAGDPAVIEARLYHGGHGVLVVGLAEGSSDLKIERTNGTNLTYKVVVRADSQSPMDQIKELLSDFPELRVDIVGTRAVLRGSVKSQVDLDKIRKIEAVYTNAILDLSTFDPAEIAETNRQAILRDLHEAGMDSVMVQVNNDTAILDGVVDSDAAAAFAVEKAKTRVTNVKSLLGVQRRMIETDLQFVEIDHEKGSSFGTNVLNSLALSGGFSVANTGRPSLGLTGAATASINAQLLSQNCNVLYQDHLNGVSGQEVTFKNGGTSYFVVGGPMQPVPWGVVIRVKPTMQGRDWMQMDVSVDVNAPVVGGPGAITLTGFSTTTSLMAKVGQSVILSGFAQALASQSGNKTPILGNIPLLNLLFSEKRKDKNHKEAVLVLTPYPSSGLAPVSRPFSEGAREILNGPVSSLPLSSLPPSSPPLSSQPVPPPAK